jgi:hypothetical protein
MEPGIKKRAFFIIGTGQFGKKAALHLNKNPKHTVYCVDPDPVLSEWARANSLIFYEMDGIEFLLNHFEMILKEDYIIPALPIHLAAYWLIAKKSPHIKKTYVPKEFTRKIPNALELNDMSYVTSYATFKCPDNCVESVICPVTGKKRPIPLYKFLSNIKFPGWHIHIIRSKQLGPGIGGYKKIQLEQLLDLIESHPNLILGSACNCHGIITALRKH